MPIINFVFAILIIINQNVNDEYFVDAFVDNIEPFVNEQITYTFRYYYQTIPPASEPPEYSPPSFTGFRTRKFAPVKRKIEVIDGIKYRVEEIRTALFPVSHGRYEIDPASFYIPSFDLRFEQPKTLKTRPIEVNVKPLPERGKPANFNGAVGKYQIKAQIDKNTVAIGQAVKLEIVLSGIGDIETCNPPNMQQIEHFDIYEPTEELSIVDDSMKLKGKINWKYVLIAQKLGNYTIPPIKFSYFNPNTKVYELTQTQPIPMVIIQETDKPVYGEETERINSESTTVKSDKPKNGSNKYLFWVIILTILIPLAFVLAIIFKKRRNPKDETSYVQEDFAKITNRRLEELGNSIGSKDAVQFSTELAKIINKYISIKFDIPVSKFNKDYISSRLSEAEYSAQTVSKLIEVLEQCDYIKFAPADVNAEDIRNIFQSAKKVIKLLEGRKNVTKNA